MLAIELYPQCLLYFQIYRQYLYIGFGVAISTCTSLLCPQILLKLLQLKEFRSLLFSQSTSLSQLIAVNDKSLFGDGYSITYPWCQYWRDRGTKVPGQAGLHSEALPQKIRSFRVVKESTLFNFKYWWAVTLVKATLSEFIKKERCHRFLMLKREEVLVQAMHGSVNSQSGHS